jgi:signal recognition particle subunit SRP54
MFDHLSSRLEAAFRKLAGRGTITDKHVSDAMRDVRLALLEADVHFSVVKSFIDKASEKALGLDVLQSVDPVHQVVKIIHDELVHVLGSHNSALNLDALTPVIMIVGLQGSGKTTLSGKLARHLQKKGRRPLLVAADVHRPAAADQLKILAGQIDAPVFTPTDAQSNDPVDICNRALEYARQQQCDTVLLDTAGRLHVDDDLMAELETIKTNVKPSEVLFVADGMTGQDAVNTAQTFQKRVDFTGVVLTKLDGDARGGAALSIRSVTGKPIKFIGVGEKLDALEEFHPDRMASRLLGMGDIVTLVEKAQENIDIEKAKALEEKIRKNQFTLEDFADQIHQLNKLGSIESLLRLIPGVGHRVKQLQIDDRVMNKMAAIISSMTPMERRKPQIIDGKRRLRIARGSGTAVQDVNQLLKQFSDMQKMMKKMGNMNPAELMRMMPMGKG